MEVLGIDRPFTSTFVISDMAENVRYNFHRHRQHQLIFPVSGLIFIETKSSFYVSSPQVGLWIPAGVCHASTTKSAQTLSGFFSPAEFPKIAPMPVMVHMTPLLQEAMKHAVAHQGDSKEYTSALFRVIHGTTSENILKGEWPSLPVGSSETLRKTIELLMQDLSMTSVRDLAKRSGQSERTLRRKFLQELGMGPEVFIQRARLLRAMQLLMGNQEQPVIEIGLEVGYSNHSAFTSAFRKLTGLTPSAFRKGDVP